MKNGAFLFTSVGNRRELVLRKCIGQFKRNLTLCQVRREEWVAGIKTVVCRLCVGGVCVEVQHNLAFMVSVKF